MRRSERDAFSRTTGWPVASKVVTKQCMALVSGCPLAVAAGPTLCPASKPQDQDDADGQQGAGEPERDECLAPIRAVAHRIEDPDADAPRVERPNKRGDEAKDERTESRRPGDRGCSNPRPQDDRTLLPRWFTPIGTSSWKSRSASRLRAGSGKGIRPSSSSPKITSMVQPRWIGHEEKMIFTGSALRDRLRSDSVPTRPVGGYRPE